MAGHLLIGVLPPFCSSPCCYEKVSFDRSGFGCCVGSCSTGGSVDGC
jgi:hypothetical protein